MTDRDGTDYRVKVYDEAHDGATVYTDPDVTSVKLTTDRVFVRFDRERAGTREKIYPRGHLLELDIGSDRDVR